MDVALQKATRQHTKLYNNRLVLRAIYDYGAISRAELARLTHLTRATVSEVVADLIRQGLVEEVGHGPAAVGRTPVLLSVIADGRQLIAVDVANGEARGAIVNLRGEIQQRITLSINNRDGAAVVALLYDLIDTLLTQVSRPLLGIGIGTPGLVNRSGGVRQAVNLGWYDVPLQDLVQTRYGLPTHVANDSQLAALAEYTFGVAHPPRNLAVLLVGRGVGAGIILNGHLFAGDAGGAGEIGHVAALDNGAPCRCGNTGCLETVVSSRAIIRRAQELAHEYPRSLLHHLTTRPAEITLEVVQAAGAAGDPAVQQLISEVGQHLGSAIAQLIGFLNIRHILLAGQVSAFGAPLLRVVRQAVAARSLNLLTHETEIAIARLGRDTVTLGAAALLLTAELGLHRLGNTQRPLATLIEADAHGAT